MKELQEPTDTLQQDLWDQGRGVADVAEHGLSLEGAQVHVPCMPQRRGHAFHVALADSGPGILAALAHNPGLPKQNTDSEAIGPAVQELASGAGIPIRGIGLRMTVTEMCKPGRKLWIHSGLDPPIMYGEAGADLRRTLSRQCTMAGSQPRTEGMKPLGRRSTFAALQPARDRDHPGK